MEESDDEPEEPAELIPFVSEGAFSTLLSAPPPPISRIIVPRFLIGGGGAESNVENARNVRKVWSIVVSFQLLC
jgi:hypothetical protein